MLNHCFKKKKENPQEVSSVRKWDGWFPSTPTLICLFVAGSLMLVTRVSLLCPYLCLSSLSPLLCLSRNFCGLTCKTKSFLGNIKEEVRCNTWIADVIHDFSVRAQSLPGIPLATLFLREAVFGLDTLCSTGTVLQRDVVNCLTVS